MSDFLREDRYLVIKYADMSAALTGAEREAMARLVEKIDGHRRRRDKDVLKAVVVEHDWPEYESVWKMIESRVSGVEQPQAACRGDGRCQYAIDSGAEGIAHCPKGKCVMPQQAEAVPQGWGEHEIAQAAMEAEIPDSKLESLLLALPQRVTQPQAEAVPTIYVSRRQLENLKPDPEDEAGTYLPVRKTPKGKFTHPLFAAPQQAEPKCECNATRDTFCEVCTEYRKWKQPQAEHDLKDVRCECCGYMTHHREHMGCIRAASKQPQAEAVPLDNETKTMKLMGLVDDLIAADPDRAERFIETVLARNALQKRLKQQQAKAVPPDPRPVIEMCAKALAEELAAWDIDPPLHHVKEASDACEAWLAAAAIAQQKGSV